MNVQLLSHTHYDHLGSPSSRPSTDSDGNCVETCEMYIHIISTLYSRRRLGTFSCHDYKKAQRLQTISGIAPLAY